MKKNPTRLLRFAALAGVILIAAMYLVALISLFFASEFAFSMLKASLFCTFIVPVILYAFRMVLPAPPKDPDSDDTASNN